MDTLGGLCQVTEKEVRDALEKFRQVGLFSFFKDFMRAEGKGPPASAVFSVIFSLKYSICQTAYFGLACPEPLSSIWKPRRKGLEETDPPHTVQTSGL